MGLCFGLCICIFVYLTETPVAAKVTKEPVVVSSGNVVTKAPIEKTTAKNLRVGERIVNKNVQKSLTQDGKDAKQKPNFIDIKECLDEKSNVKRPYPPTSSCEDSLGTYSCSILFGIPSTQMELNRDQNENYKVSVRCFDPNFALAARQCSSTCAKCCKLPQYKCDDLARSKCLLMKNLKMCTHPGIFHIALSECAQSCGLCDKPGASGVPCPDTAPDCDTLQAFLDCNDPYMKRNCKGRCKLIDCETTAPSAEDTPLSSTTCKDDRVNCAIVAHRCNDSNYGFAIRSDCQKTCGLC